MPYKPVDTAIKVIVGPLIDDTDFKAREEGIVYNQAGMEIDVIVEKADGTIVTTAVTPTTSGDYDWTHTDQGYYELELPASGGASFNNTEEGILRVVGYCTGVLPFSSVAYDVVPTMIYDSLIKGTDKLEVDAVEVSSDSGAADNLEADYDGTGYAKANSTIGTTTINTDMRGTDSAALASALSTHDGKLDTVDGIVDAVKAKTDNLPTDPADASVIAAAFGVTDGKIDAVKAETALIVEDTGTTLPATLSTIEGYVDLIDDATDGLAKIRSYVDILDDATNGNAAIKVEVEGLAGEAMRGTDGIDVAGALTDINLDHLMFAPTANRDTLPEVVDDTVLANIITKTDGDTSDFDHATDSLEAIRDKQHVMHGGLHH